MDKRTILFIDGDDTLWDTQSLYDRAITTASEKVRLEGFDVRHWSQALHNAEMELIPTFGFGKERFVSSLVQAYGMLCEQQGKKPSPGLSRAIQPLGNQVFEAKAPQFTDARETLKTISAFLPIYLISAGPEDMQRKRLLDSELEQFLVGYRFPNKKTAEVFESLISELKIEPCICWHIGNSIKSDINPARESGLNAILVGQRGWVYDKADILAASTRFERVSTLSDVIPILRQYYNWSE